MPSRVPTLLPLLDDANSLSTFRSEGQLYSLIVRPLLPGETGYLARWLRAVLGRP